MAHLQIINMIVDLLNMMISQFAPLNNQMVTIIPNK